MLRFLIDTQLPPQLSHLLNQWGYNSLHTSDFPDGHLLNDKAIREIAINDNRIIVSKDSYFFDFFHLFIFYWFLVKWNSPNNHHGW